MFNGMNQLDSEVFIKNIDTDFSFIQQLVIEYLSCAYRCIIYAYIICIYAHIWDREYASTLGMLDKNKGTHI